jgi:DNA-binding CsgD family transcriptional regulator
MGEIPARVLSLVGEIGGLLDIDELRDGLLSALRAELPCDYISINQVAADPQQCWSIVAPALPARQHERFRHLALQNPLAEHHMRTRDGRPLRLSDVATRAELHATELYREVYAPLGIEHQIAFTLPSAGGQILAIVLSRREDDFSEAERELLALARPHLIQAYRNALYVSRRPAPAAPSRLGPDEDALQALGLTPAQARVLRLIAMGRSTAAIAEDLQIAPRTVNKHLQRTYAKLDIADRFAAADCAWRAAAAQPS